jgi:hypothetical protein
VALSPTSSHGGGTYTPPTSLERITNQASMVTTPTATYTTLPLAHQSGAALLSYTDPSNPTVVTAGIYALNVQIDVGGGTKAAGYLYAEIDLTGGGFDVQETVTIPLQTNGSNDPQASLTLVRYCPAGTVVNVVVWQNSGGDLDIGIGSSCFLQRIT